MIDEKQQRAQATYNTLIEELESHEWKYTKDDENLKISCKAQGEDLPMEIDINVDKDRQLILLISHLPFVIPQSKRLDAAIATSVANNIIADGSFDYDITSGHMFFRMTSSFLDCEIGGELFSYMLLCSFTTIDDFNDKFFMLGKGMLSVEQFIEEYKGE